MPPKTLLCKGGQWYAVELKPDEPPKQSFAVSWKQINNNISAEQAYRDWFAEQRAISKIVYLNKNEH